MMGTKNYSIVVGVDVGTAFTKVVIGKVVDGSVEILGLSETPTEGLSGGTITNLFKLEETLNNAVSSAEDSAGIDIRSVNLSIFGNYIKIGKYQCSTKVTNYNGLITKNDVNKLLRDISNVTTQPDCKILSIVPIFYSTDTIKNIVDPVGMIGTNLSGEYNIIYAQNNVLRQFSECLSNCNLELESISTIPESLANVIFNQDEKDNCSCILDMGAGSTVLSVFKNNAIQNVVSIPFGGNSITNDLKNAFGLSFEQAEKIKMTHADVFPENISQDEIVEVPNLSRNNTIKIYKYDIAQVIAARVKEIFKILSNEFTKQQIFINWKSHDMHFVGGCAKIPNITALAEEMFGTRCFTGTLNARYKFLNLDPTFFPALGCIVRDDEDTDENRYENPVHQKKNISQGSFLKNMFVKAKKFLVD